MTAYDRMGFLADGFMTRDLMAPKTLKVWREEWRRELEHRGGMVGAGHYDRSIANKLMREVVELATRRFRNELIPRVSEHMDDEVVEELEIALSDVLARTLDRIQMKETLRWPSISTALSPTSYGSEPNCYPAW
jgi:hypothetical protein